MEEKGYIYIVRAPRLQPCKVGFSRNLRTRLDAHASNSSAPYKWVPWTAFQLNLADARKLERLVKSDKGLSEFKVWGKGEVFDCRPIVLSEAIERIALEHSLPMLKRFPYCREGVRELAGNFPSLPAEVLFGMPEDERVSYWTGIRDALWVLSRLEGLTISSEDFLTICGLTDINEAYSEPEAWKTILNYFRNCSSLENRKIAEMAVKQAMSDEASAFESWQE